MTSEGKAVEHAGAAEMGSGVADEMVELALLLGVGMGLHVHVWL